MAPLSGVWTAGSSELSLHVLEDEPGFRLETASPMHALHLRLDRLGQVAMSIGEHAQNLPFRPAATAFVAAGQSVNWRIGAGLKRLVLRFSLEFLTELAVIEDCVIADSPDLREPSHDPVLEHYAGLVLYEAGRTQAPTASFLRAFARLAGAHLLRHYLRPAASIIAEASAAPKKIELTEALRTRIDAYIRDTLPAPIVIEALAAACALTHYQLLRIIKRATGSTAQQYVLEVRIELARKMLRESDLALTEIALALGFSSQSHFSHTFRAFTQCTPKSYRERNDLI
jgi:AraC-like DNA-binding protein